MPKQMSYNSPVMNLANSYWVLEQISANFHPNTGGGKFVFLCYASKADYDAGKQHIDSYTIQSTVTEIVSLLSPTDASAFRDALATILSSGYKLSTLKRQLKPGYTFDGTNYKDSSGIVVTQAIATTSLFDSAIDVA